MPFRKADLRWLFHLLALLLLGAGAGTVAARPATGPVAEVSVRRSGSDWTADYRLRRQAPAWAFIHSGIAHDAKLPWRATSWSVETPGVRIIRRGRYDVFVADRGPLPSRVQIRFTPVQADLEGTYSPALIFTTGAVALFSDQFDLAPLDSADAALRLPASGSDIPPGAGSTEVRFHDEAGPLLHQGARKLEAVTISGRTYVLFGPADVVSSPQITTVLDPALPDWISGQLKNSTTGLLAYYDRLLGRRTAPRPMLMATWAGATPNVASMNGGVLPGLVLMSFHGSGIEQESAAMSDHVQWFIAHESAHFWLGDMVQYDAAGDAWIMEGGADLLAVRALAALDPAYDPRARLDRSVRTCAGFARGRGINSANQRGEHEAYYACGAVFALIAEGAARRAGVRDGFAGFWRSLIAANRKDGVVSQAEWLAELTRVSKDPELAAGIRRMAEAGEAEPERAIAALFRRAGVVLADGQEGLHLQ